jgi:hypothetical protein
MTLEEQYNQLREKYHNLFTQTNAIANRIAILRLVAVAIGVYGCYYAYNAGQTPMALVAGFATVVVFLFLVSRHLKYKDQARLYTALKQVNENELRYLEGDLSPFKTGQVYTETAHRYTYDLDIFGEKSVFQHLDRTTTGVGERQLADALQDNEQLDIPAQQEAVRELALNIGWRQNFYATGLLNVQENLNTHKFTAWLNTRFAHSEKSVLRMLSYILPAATVLSLAAHYIGNWPLFFDIFKGLFLLNLIIVATQKKHIGEEHRLLDNMSPVLKNYEKLLQLIENQNFKASTLKQNQAKLTVEGETASAAIGRLSKILNQFDSLLNPFMAILINGFFQYHLHAVFGLEKWKKKYKTHVLDWFSTIGEFEAHQSLGNFTHNHPDFIFPEITDKPVLDLAAVGHPLIALEKRICNDVAFTETKFIVLTGSNMSGKSTFLRTLGVNLVLAKIGAPVCAKRFLFYPFNVCVSMRIDDSLQNSESLFFSELKRLKGIIETLDKPQKPFIILDEILRGTNSNDKRAGTQGLIQRLVAKNAVGIIATHDLVIGEMVTDYPQYISNHCFEAEIIADELRFDYKLKPGICQQMSAAFLMKKMDII